MTRRTPHIRPCSVVIVGCESDPHVAAVVHRLRPEGTVVVDIASLPSRLEAIDLEGCIIEDVTRTDTLISQEAQVRGWIRRLAPAGWGDGTRVGSHTAAVTAARLSALGAILRDSSISWITPISSLISSENRMVQYRAARLLGNRVPSTLITTSIDRLSQVLGETFLVKPLGPGDFRSGNSEHVVFAQATTPGQLRGVDLGSAPFLAQETLTAQRHLRIVTVQDQGWVAELDAHGLPYDWRSHAPAHDQFEVSDDWQDTLASAIRLANELGVGHSSQDWLVDNDGPVFLDLNPGGQWMFLPDPIPELTSSALALALAGVGRTS